MSEVQIIFLYNCVRFFVVMVVFYANANWNVWSAGVLFVVLVVLYATYEAIPASKRLHDASILIVDSWQPTATAIGSCLLVIGLGHLKVLKFSEVGGSLLSRMVKQMVDERFVELWRTKMRGRKEDGLGSIPNPSFTWTLFVLYLNDYDWLKTNKNLLFQVQVLH